jgi:hypothetical protein
MDLSSDFKTFLSEIRPTENERDDLIRGHKTLRERLKTDETISKIRVSDFLQGSYRRSTAVRSKGGRGPDADIIIVTKLSEEEYEKPSDAMEVFRSFLETHYKGKWKFQCRSIGIELSYVDLDLVITSAPSEAEIDILRSESVTSDEDLEVAQDWKLNPAWVSLSRRGSWNPSDGDLAQFVQRSESEAEWKLKPLRIPDRKAEIWQDTHPLEQIRWTRDKNQKTNCHFVNVVKAIKWWRLEKHEEPKHPKGFPLERIIGECCPDGITSVAEGFTRTLEKIVSQFAIHVNSGGKPSLSDYGVPGHDVWERITAEDFKLFYDQVKEGSELARKAYDSQDRTESGNLWRELLGSKFPEPSGNDGSGKQGFTPRTEPSVPGGGRFA